MWPSAMEEVRGEGAGRLLLHRSHGFNPLALGDHTPGASHPYSTSPVLPEPHSAGDSADPQFEDTVKAGQFSSHSC